MEINKLVDLNNLRTAPQLFYRQAKKLLEELDKIIADNNLQFVEHNVQETIDKDGINIKFNVFEGKKTLVERINITGNNITNEDVIRGELLLDEGDPFTKLNLEKSVWRYLVCY